MQVDTSTSTTRTELIRGLMNRITRMSQLHYITSVAALITTYTVYRTYQLYRNIQHAEYNIQHYAPSMILVLGGDIEREIAGIDLYHKLNQSNTPCILLISSGNLGMDDKQLIELCNRHECVCNYHAVDTVSNYTTTIPYITKHHKHIIILTSEYHMSRAISCAQLLLICGHGVAITPFSAVHEINHNDTDLIKQAQAETRFKCYRDIIRCILYLYVGIDGGFINRFIHPNRIQAAKRNIVSIDNI